MFEDYRARMNRRGNNLSDILRRQSDAVVNATWMQSISHRPVIVKSVDSGLPQFDEMVDEILDAHFDQKSKYNITGDEVAYWLRFRPHTLMEHSEIAVGSYVSIPDCDGVRETWLIIHIEDDGEQKWCQILKCNWIYKWIYQGKIYEVLGCQRYASSYNSGIFFGDRTTSVENMNGFWVPTNSDTDKIGYDQRFIINDGNREIPICWSVSKIETTIPVGLSKFTVAQVPFDPIHDNVELGIANYYGSSISPEDSQTGSEEDHNFVITYNGSRPTIKVGGSEKIFTAQIPEDNNSDVVWSVFDGANTYSCTNVYDDYTMITDGRVLRLKVAQNYNLVGKTLTIKAQCSDGSNGEIQIEVIA